MTVARRDERATSAAPFALIFGGGTALARAHRIIRRISEDAEFKIVPAAAAPVSRSIVRQRPGALQDRITQTLQAAGFAFDPADPANTKSRNENHYTIWQFPYVRQSQSPGLAGCLRSSSRAASANSLRGSIPSPLFNSSCSSGTYLFGDE
jgi:hypothetical protein